MNVIDRVQARVTVDENGCHIFEGARYRGYGRVGIGTRTAYTHRVMYEAVKGPVPPGLHIDHLCRNRACCNPDHLEAVTQAENNLRAAIANRKPTCGVLRIHDSARNPWRAEIAVNGRNVHLGLFPTQEAAMEARLQAERRLRPADADRKQEILSEVKALGGES